MGYGNELRKRIEDDGILVAPGVHDPLSARVADQVGFDLVSMTGNGSSVSKIGQPDVGVMTLTEMVENAKRIQQTVNIPPFRTLTTGSGTRSTLPAPSASLPRPASQPFISKIRRFRNGAGSSRGNASSRKRKPSGRSAPRPTSAMSATRKWCSSPERTLEERRTERLRTRSTG